MRLTTKIAAALLGALTLAAPAHAVTFDLRSERQTGRDVDTARNGQVSLVEDGIGLTVKGTLCFSIGCEIAGSLQDVQRWQNGVGIKRGRGDSHAVDGNNYFYGRFDEMVILQFDQAVRLERLDFNYINGVTDDFALWEKTAGVWNKIQGRTSIVDDDAGNHYGSGHFSFDNPFVGSVFGVASTDASDSWKLSAANVAAVPLPAGILLLATAFGATAMVRRRKTA